MFFVLKDFVSRYFNGSVGDFAVYAGLVYSTAAKRVADPRQYVFVENGGFRLFKFDRELAVRAYDIHYDHFHPYFLRFAYDSTFYSVLQSGRNTDGTPILKLIAQTPSGEPDISMSVRRHPESLYTSLIFINKSGKGIFEFIFEDEIGANLVMHTPHAYTFRKSGVRVEDPPIYRDFHGAIEASKKHGYWMYCGKLCVYQPT